MSLMTDDELTECMAEMLYDHSINGFSRDEAPTWLGAPDELRRHWRDIARVALGMVRTADGAG
jgi:hypothetical protein